MEEVYTIAELYEALKGARSRGGLLHVPGFEPGDYVDLYYAVMRSLADYFEGDYPTWYRVWAQRYARHLRANCHRWDPYIPQVELPLEEQPERMQLVILKFFVGRRYWQMRDPWMLSKKGVQMSG